MPVENVTQHPVTTSGGLLVGVGQYLIQYGATPPHDKASLLSFLSGLLIIAVGGLLRDPAFLKLLGGASVLALLLTGCATPAPSGPGAAVSDAQTQVRINAGVGGVTMLGCQLIPAADRGSVLAALTAADQVARVDPKQALLTLQANPATNWIWYALGDQLKSVQGITESQWWALAQGALRSAISGCAAGLGAQIAGSVPLPERLDRRAAAGETRRRGGVS